MKTAIEYLNKNELIIPCDGKIPKVKEWQKKEFTINDFEPGDNFGLKLRDYTDIDIDCQRAVSFIFKYVEPCSAVFGRGNKPISHYLYRGSAKYKKFSLHKDLENYYKDLPHGACLLECRSGVDKQTIMPGSIIDGEEVKWQIFEGLSPYPGDILEDLSKAALGTALSILYPSQGNRDDYTYAVACILAKHTKWKDYEIDDFVEHLAEHSGDDQRRSGKGSHAYKQIANGGKVKGFNTLREILQLEEASSLYKMFEWVGVNPPNKNLEELKKRFVYIQDSASMYDTETHIEQKKEDFNNDHLFHFPGGKNKKKAFESLMTDFEFFHEKKVKGRAVLPGADYPIAEIDYKHFYLEPGRYLNLYPGPPIDAVKGDCSDWINPFKLILGEDYYEHIEQFYAALIQKVFKYKLDLTADQSDEIGPIKIQWGYLLVGPEGTGKKAMAETLQRIIGRKFVDANATYDEMIGNHSEVIYNKLFIFINEVVTTGDVEKKTEISNKLKPFWTDEDSKINPKHIRPFRYWNNANGMCFSNEENCLHLGKSSRRYGVINLYDRLSLAKLQQFENDGTFEKIWKFIQSDRIKHLFHHLLYEVKVKDWKLYNRGRAPITDALRVMQDEAQHPTIQKLDRAFKTKTDLFDNSFPGFTSLDNILDYIRKGWKIQINEKYVKDWLKQSGFKWKNGKQTRQALIPVSGGRPRMWLLEDSDYLRELSETALGSAPQHTINEYEEIKLNNALNNFSYGKTTKREVIIRFLKRVFGPKWTTSQELNFYEELHLIFLKKDSGLNMLLRKFKIGEKQSAGATDDQYDFKSYIEAKTKIGEASKEEQETLLKKYLGKQFKSLPSDILADVFEEDKE
tara:strand:- start:345 stop:2903 length:2559 start_codon:yes stop_codon:yes gene_type:complete